MHRHIIIWGCVAVHVLACLALLASSGGTEIVPDVEERMRWVREHTALWTATWIAWALASSSLLAFAVVWTRDILQRGGPRNWAILGCSVIALGLLFDLVGETVNLLWPTQTTLTVAEFAWGARLYAILSAGTANGLYCVGGMVLSAISWRMGWLRGAVGILGLVMWSVGLLLTAMVVFENERGMIVTGGLVMMLFIPWAGLVGWRITRRRT